MSYDMIIEDVPFFTKRDGDFALQGSNNSIIIMGMDRAKNGPATIDDGLGNVKSVDKGKGCGTVHIIAGRQDKNGDPDFKLDNSFLYLSMKTEADKNLDIKTKGVPQDSAASAAILKSDQVRVVTRKNIKILMEDSKSFVFLDKDRALISIGDGSGEVEVKGGKITLKNNSGASVVIEGAKVSINGVVEHAILGDTFMKQFPTHMHSGGAAATGGNTGPVVAPLVNVLSQKVTLG